MEKAWQGFVGQSWKENIDVRDFIVQNFTPYTGDGQFLQGISQKTQAVYDVYDTYLQKERERGGVFDIDTQRVSSLLSYEAGYMDKQNEVIVGFQTDVPLKRGVNPFGGLRMAESAVQAYGYEFSQKLRDQFAYRTTHNDGVFRVYTTQMRRLRKNGILTGLPDAYGRGRIIGDYRRVALYGVDRLIAGKKQDMLDLENLPMNDENIRLREEVFRQIDFLKKLKEMAQLYGMDISAPAQTAKEAVQWLYFAYLGAIKEQNGAAMSLGRVSTFLDIYFERDLQNGVLDESGAQEILDQFVLKLRCARQLRTPEYNELFAGDPTWVTEAVGGMAQDGRPLVTKTSFRILHTLYNLAPSPEPNLTVLWSKHLPQAFKEYCAKVSYDTCSIQYENDDIMRPQFGDDYCIACCVSAMTCGKQMQFFGARCNLPKVLLLAINGGRDEMTGEQIAPKNAPLKSLTYDEVMQRFDKYLRWLCKVYVDTMNVIHYMHDKYAYEKLQMALHDTHVGRLMAFGLAGISVAADSLSAIKYGKVTPVFDDSGLIVDYDVQGDFPMFGNNDDRVDSIAEDLVQRVFKYLKKRKAYRNAQHTLSLLTITSNVVYGKKTGATPCGRKAGQPFAPGANPMHHREQNGALASLCSLAKLSYECCKDGISNTFTVTPSCIGQGEQGVKNLATLLDGYFDKGGHHINVNVLNRQTLLDAMHNPQKYPNLTIRVSGYAVRFNSLTDALKAEVLERTFFEN